MSNFTKFKKALNPGLTARRSGVLGFGRKVVVEGGGLKYTIDKSQADEERAALLNSKIPAVTIKPNR